MFCQDIATNWLLTAGSYLLSFPTFTFSLSLLSRTQIRWYVMSGHCHRLTSCCWFLPYRFPPKCLFVLFLTFSAQIHPRQCVNKIWLFTPFMASEFGIKKHNYFFTSIWLIYTYLLLDYVFNERTENRQRFQRLSKKFYNCNYNYKGALKTLSIVPPGTNKHFPKTL